MHLLRLLTVAAFLVSGSVAVATPLWLDLGEPTGVLDITPNSGVRGAERAVRRPKYRHRF